MFIADNMRNIIIDYVSNAIGNSRNIDTTSIAIVIM